MINILLIAVAFTYSSQPAKLQRQERQDTIYVVRGAPGALEAFRTKLGDNWSGGKFLSGSSKKGSLRYWAFSDRTASEAREFIMPAVFSGLQLKPEQYDEARAFPTERRVLDQIAISCGAKSDPFFIDPERDVELTTDVGSANSFRTCLRNQVKKLLGLSLYEASE